MGANGKYKFGEKTVLFSINVNDFEKLEKYHYLNSPDNINAIEAGYGYFPSLNYRRYEPGFEEIEKNGFGWKLTWHDWTLKKLPQLKCDESGKCIGHIL